MGRSASAPLGEMSNGKVPQRLKAAMNMRMALDGVVPTSWVAAAKAAFSLGQDLRDNRGHVFCHGASFLKRRWCEWMRATRLGDGL